MAAVDVDEIWVDATGVATSTDRVSKNAESFGLG